MSLNIFKNNKKLTHFSLMSLFFICANTTAFAENPFDGNGITDLSTQLAGRVMKARASPKDEASKVKELANPRKDVLLFLKKMDKARKILKNPYKFYGEKWPSAEDLDDRTKFATFASPFKSNWLNDGADTTTVEAANWIHTRALSLLDYSTVKINIKKWVREIMRCNGDVPAPTPDAFNPLSFHHDIVLDQDLYSSVYGYMENDVMRVKCTANQVSGMDLHSFPCGEGNDREVKVGDNAWENAAAKNADNMTGDDNVENSDKLVSGWISEQNANGGTMGHLEATYDITARTVAGAITNNGKGLGGYRIGIMQLRKIPGNIDAYYNAAEAAYRNQPTGVESDDEAFWDDLLNYTETSPVENGNRYSACVPTSENTEDNPIPINDLCSQKPFLEQ